MDKDQIMWYRYLYAKWMQKYMTEMIRSDRYSSSAAENARMKYYLAQKRNAQNKPLSKARLKTTDFTADHLEERDLQEIIARVGSKVENIYDLTPGQKWMLGDGSVVTSEFFLQFLFMAVMPIQPYTLRRKLEEVCEKRDNLRSAYLSRGLSRPYRVVLENRQAELNFEDLSELSDKELDEKLRSVMDADRRRGFDLERDVLLRISVYKTAKKDTYAILLSQPHINTDGVSTIMLLKDLFVDYAIGTSGLEMMLDSHLPQVSYDAYAKWLASRDREKELAYWMELLKDLPPCTGVPGALQRMQGKALVSHMSMTFSPATQKGLREKQTAFHVTLHSIMQTAWSILLMKMYHTDDVSFGTVTSGREAQVEKSTMMMGGFINAIPVRAHVNGDGETVAELARDLQKQLITSLDNAHCSPDEIREALGRKGRLFDHLLNFHNFDSMLSGDRFAGEKEIPGLRLLDRKLYDNLSMDLTLYFQKRKNEVGCSFVYDLKKLSDARIRILMAQFGNVVDQIAGGAEDLKIRDIVCADLHAFDRVNLDEQAMFEEIVSFLSGLELFADLSNVQIRRLARMVRIFEYMQDDIIIMERGEVSDLQIVFEGSVEMYRKASDGWIHPLMIIKRGKLLTASGIWEEEHSYFGARAYDDGSRVLSIPGTVMQNLMMHEPSIGKKLMRMLDRRTGALSLLWINLG